MPAGDHETMRALSDAQVQQFIEDGFIRIDRPFRGSLPTRAVPSCGGTPDAIRTTRQRGENRSFGSVITSRRRSGPR